MEKALTKIDLNDWLEKPMNRTSKYKQVSEASSLANSILADDGLAISYNNNPASVANKNVWEGVTSYEVNIEPMLYPQTHVPEYFMDNYQKAKLATDGISKQSFEHFKQRAKLDYNQTAELLSVARNTLINKKGTETFDTSISEKLISLSEVYTHGFNVFGDENAFISWLKTPNTALGMITPFSLLKTQYGRQEVQHVLGRIEWGVYS